MDKQIIGLSDWFETVPGQYLLDWERRHFDEAVGDMFGFHALQMGLAVLPALRQNRMLNRWLALPAPAADCAADTQHVSAKYADLPGVPGVALFTHFAFLPFPECSLDLVVLPHTLELSDDPHSTLREVERVLVPEGKLVISGLNPASLWGFRQQRAHWWRRLGVGELFLPDEGEFIGFWRLRDWLRLLGFEVESAHFGCYRPAFENPHWMEQSAWMEPAGARWWPIFGAAYFLVAVKRVRGMRMLETNWKNRTQRVTAPAVAVRREPTEAPAQSSSEPGS